jgi:hypothetical protein
MKRGKGYAVNVPLRDGITDEAFHSIFKPVSDAAVRTGLHPLQPTRLSEKKTIRGHRDFGLHSLFTRSFVISSTFTGLARSSCRWARTVCRETNSEVST